MYHDHQKATRHYNNAIQQEKFQEMKTFRLSPTHLKVGTSVFGGRNERAGSLATR